MWHFEGWAHILSSPWFLCIHWACFNCQVESVNNRFQRHNLDDTKKNKAAIFWCVAHFITSLEFNKTKTLNIKMTPLESVVNGFWLHYWSNVTQDTKQKDVKWFPKQRANIWHESHLQTQNTKAETIINGIRQDKEMNLNETWLATKEWQMDNSQLCKCNERSMGCKMTRICAATWTTSCSWNLLSTDSDAMHIA